MEDVPPQLKALKRYMREAKMIEKTNAKLAYYCRLYAMKEALKKPSEVKDAPEVKSWLTTLMVTLEKSSGDGGDKAEAEIEIQNFAERVFDHADTEDRAGNATKKTAAAFNRAFVYFEILKQFGERDSEIEAKSKYCLFKTTDILKAFKEGRTPDPGPPGGMDLGFGSGGDGSGDTEMSSAATGGGASDMSSGFGSTAAVPSAGSPMGSAPTSGTGMMGGYGSAPPSTGGYPGMGAPPSYGGGYGAPPATATGYPTMGGGGAYYGAPPQSTTAPAAPTTTSVSSSSTAASYSRADLKRFEDKVMACAEAERMMKHAFSAMKFNDVPTAVDRLEAALMILRRHNT